MISLPSPCGRAPLESVPPRKERHDANERDARQGLHPSQYRQRLLCCNLAGDQFDYTPGLEEIMPTLELAMDGLVKGEKRRIVLDPEVDPDMKLSATRLAYLLGHEGEPLILNVEML